jgi:hypothetical protein
MRSDYSTTVPPERCALQDDKWTLRHAERSVDEPQFRPGGSSDQVELYRSSRDALEVREKEPLMSFICIGLGIPIPSRRGSRRCEW